MLIEVVDTPIDLSGDKLKVPTQHSPEQIKEKSSNPTDSTHII